MSEHAQFEDMLFYVRLFGLIGIPSIMALFGWLLTMDRRIRHMARVGDELLEMHENPENTGFGTVGMGRVIEDNTRALRELSHFVRWSTKQQTGKEAPPFMEDRK